MNDMPTPSAGDSDATEIVSDDSLRDMARGALKSTGAPRVKPGGWRPPSAEELQTMLPGYEVQKFIARGGMGAVYRGVQKGLGRVVAIKILPPELQESDPHFAERFKQEARAMAHLNHPGIVAVYDSGEMSDGTLFFVMEFIEGTDVAQMVAAGGRLPSDHAMAIAAHVCDALQYAHDNGVIHRDIKPANIMVGYDGRVKVADFGLAKINQADASGLTQSGMVMGTLHFMAPEALTLGSAIDHRADIYAVGVMLYQMLTGKLPQGMFEMPSLKVPGLDPRYDGIVAQAMRENRDQRYQQIHDMRLALDSIVTEPVAKLDVDAEPAAALPTFARPQRSPHQPFRPPPPQVVVKYEQRSNAWLWVALTVVMLALGWLMLKDKQRPASSSPAASAEQVKAGSAARNEAVSPAAPKAAITPSTFPPSAATKEQPYVNTLGMKFVPVPGTDVLMCIHETRVDDYAAYSAAVPGLDQAWAKAGWGRATLPGNYPVTYISMDDGSGFCSWLSKKEGVTYRLPTELEWRIAAGVASPDGKVKAPTYWWGESWPPPDGTGNLADATTEARMATEKVSAAERGFAGFISDYRDGHALQAPVMSFPPNPLGLFDLIGNAMERTTSGTRMPALGGCWKTGQESRLRTTYSMQNVSAGTAEMGFRCVLVLREEPTNQPTTQSSSANSALPPTKAKRVAADFTTVDGDTRIVNLLALIDPAQDAISGTWSKSSAGLLIEKGEGPCQIFPTYRAPEEYDFKIEFTSLVDEIGNVTQTCVQNDRKVYWVMQSKSSVVRADASYGFRIDERPMEQAEARTRLPLLRKDERHESIVEVRKDGIRAWFDGKPLVTWSKPLATPAPDYPDRQLGIGTWHAGVIFHRIEVIERKSVPRDPVDLPQGPTTWTDNKGRNITATFHSYDGVNVVLAIAGKLQPVPLSGLSEASAKLALAYHWQRATPEKATLSTPFVNSLGMKFVPLPGTSSLICIHETRRADYARYAKENPGISMDWSRQFEKGVPISPDESHPVTALSWHDAIKFCAWLSRRENRAYRITTDREWSMAIGIATEEDPNGPIEVLSENAKTAGIYVWGRQRTPADRFGNFADNSLHEKLPGNPYIKGFTDGFATTAPVMSFKPNALGLYDLGGNVWEWCSDSGDATRATRILRGSSWGNTENAMSLASFRFLLAPGDSRFGGFRCVLDLASDPNKTTPTTPAPAKPTSATAPPKPARSFTFGSKTESIPLEAFKATNIWLDCTCGFTSAAGSGRCDIVFQSARDKDEDGLVISLYQDADGVRCSAHIQQAGKKSQIIGLSDGRQEERLRVAPAGNGAKLQVGIYKGKLAVRCGNLTIYHPSRAFLAGDHVIVRGKECLFSLGDCYDLDRQKVSAWPSDMAVATGQSDSVFNLELIDATKVFDKPAKELASLTRNGNELTLGGFSPGQWITIPVHLPSKVTRGAGRDRSIGLGLGTLGMEAIVEAQWNAEPVVTADVGKYGVTNLDLHLGTAVVAGSSNTLRVRLSPTGNNVSAQPTIILRHLRFH